MKTIKREFDPPAFQAYLAGLRWTAWTPTGVTIHHCSAPSLAQRPDGFAQRHMDNLEYYYGFRLGWSAGPHLFIDDHKIWVFSPLTAKGVHATSFNRSDIGIEMLGNFDVEDPWSGRGLAVLELTCKAVCLIQARLHLAPGRVRFHRDDPKTTKTCPGRKVDKTRFLTLLEQIRATV